MGRIIVPVGETVGGSLREGAGLHLGHQRGCFITWDSNAPGLAGMHLLDFSFPMEDLMSVLQAKIDAGD